MVLIGSSSPKSVPGRGEDEKFFLYIHGEPSSTLYPTEKLVLHFAAYTPNLATTVGVQETPKSLQWKEKERNMTQDVLSIIFWTQIFFFIE